MYWPCSPGCKINGIIFLRDFEREAKIPVSQIQSLATLCVSYINQNMLMMVITSTVQNHWWQKKGSKLMVRSSGFFRTPMIQSPTSEVRDLCQAMIAGIARNNYATERLYQSAPTESVADMSWVASRGVKSRRVLRS